MGRAVSAGHRVKGRNMLIVDRFEGDFAVIETDFGMMNIPKSELPENVKEGDVLKFVIDAGAAKGRKNASIT